MILSEQDFKTGDLQISENDYSDLDAFITDAIETSYIRKMFGTTLGDVFLADLSGDPSVPTSPEWLAVFAQFDVDRSGYSEPCTGIKEILKGFIYRDYVSQQSVINQAGGNKSVRVEASDNEGFPKKSTIFYNRAIENYCILIYFLDQDSATYTDLKPGWFNTESAI